MNINKNTQQINNDFLVQIKKTKILSINYAIQIDVLQDLVSCNVIDDSIKLIIDCDINHIDLPHHICNLDILKYFTKIQKIILLSHSSNPLTNIDNIQYLESLRSFSLSGFLKNIKLDVLRKFSGEIEFLNIDNMIIQQKYYDIINDNPLKELSLRKLDLKMIEKNCNLRKLVVYYDLLNEELLSEKFPNLTELKLINCSKIIDFSFLKTLQDIEEITLNGVKGMTIFPTIKNKKLKSLSILHGKHFLGFESFINLESLEYLALTFTKISLNDIELILQNTSLKKFHFISEKQKMEREVIALMEKYGGRYVILDLLD